MEKENSEIWLRIFPEGESAKVYRIGTPSDEDFDTLEDVRWELYFVDSGYKARYELSEEDSYLEGSFDDGYLELDSCIRISDVISALNPSNPDNVGEATVRRIKEIFTDPQFDQSVPDAYRLFFNSLTTPWLSEEKAVQSLFKNVIKECNISHTVGIEVDGTEEDSFKVGYRISIDNEGFDKDRLCFFSFDDCWFQGLSDAFVYISSVNLVVPNIILYDGIFYANTDVDDGFYDGCENAEVYLINNDTLKDANN